MEFVDLNKRILVADDFEPWRRFVSSLIFMEKHKWRIVGEGCDGIETVKKAEELRPDLVLLDIHLPNLNGLEAARQILQIVPDSKVLFLSGFDSLEMVEAALKTGAHGYVVKLDAARELIRGVESVFRGERFVCSRFKGRIPV
jgi:DNA-binding NarL/FixJ family response regulator